MDETRASLPRLRRFIRKLEGFLLLVINIDLQPSLQRRIVSKTVFDGLLGNLKFRSNLLKLQCNFHCSHSFQNLNKLSHFDKRYQEKVIK